MNGVRRIPSLFVEFRVEEAENKYRAALGGYINYKTAEGVNTKCDLPPGRPLCLT